MAPGRMFSGNTSPGMTSSSPVENKATRGLRVTFNLAAPMLAANPKPAGFRRVPLDSTTAPLATSSPLRRIHCPTRGMVLIKTSGMSV